MSASPQTTTAGKIPPAPPPASSPPPDLPTAQIVPSRSFWTWVWLVPIAAALTTGAPIWQAEQEVGPTVTVRFAQADGLSPNDPVKYRGLTVGRVKSIDLDTGMSAVVARIELRPDAEDLATEGTTFWIVKPSFSLREVSGLDTLLGPRYIQAQSGPPGGREVSHFTGLDAPPISGEPVGTDGLDVVLEATRRGSLALGAPVLYKDMKVGAVKEIVFGPDARFVEITVTIEPTYADFVRHNSRWWNSSGINFDLGWLSGVTFKAESLETVLAGGIAFATPTRAGDDIRPGHRFELEDSPENSWLKWDPALRIGTEDADEEPAPK